MRHTLTVENIKCGGCAGTITSRLSELAGVSEVEVAVETGSVSFSGDTDIVEAVKTRLRELGYPEAGSAEGLDNLKAKAKSYVSCAVGRLES